MGKYFHQMGKVNYESIVLSLANEYIEDLSFTNLTHATHL